MIQSYLDVPLGPQRLQLLEQIERQTLRHVTQAVQELSLYSKRLFDTTPIPPGVKRTQHAARMVEHLVRRAIDRANIQPIDDFYEGDFDVRRVRWLPTPLGTIAQDLRVDAKASTESSRIRPSANQFSMPAILRVPGSGRQVRLRRIVQPHIWLRPRVAPIAGQLVRTQAIAAVTTVVYIHLHYAQQLQAIILVASPHADLRRRYNPSGDVNHIWSVGPQPDDPRAVRLNLTLLKNNPHSSWRVQTLRFRNPTAISYAEPLWRDGFPPTETPFTFVPAGPAG